MNEKGIGRDGDVEAVVTVFRYYVRPEAKDEYLRTTAGLYELAKAMPGFVSVKGFEGDDGEQVAIVEFASDETNRAWREHPEHLQAQQAGQDRFFSEFDIHAGTPVRRWRWRRSEG